MVREKMTPSDYARYRTRKTGVLFQAQLLYYYIRIKKVKVHECPCGRSVVDRKEVDEFLNGKGKDD